MRPANGSESSAPTVRVKLRNSLCRQAATLNSICLRSSTACQRDQPMDTRCMAYWSLPIIIGSNKKSLLLAVALLLLLHGTTTAASDAAGNGSPAVPMARPGCLDRCGNTSIPYPFGFGTRAGCFLPGFGLHCDDDDGAPYLGKNKTLKLLSVDLARGEVRIQNFIASSCDNDTGNTRLPVFVPRIGFWLGRDRFAVSNARNRFTAIGCATIAVIQGENQHDYTSACGSFCSDASVQNTGTECAGMGCCQIPIPGDLRAVLISFLRLDGTNYYSSVRSFSPCSYAFVAETDWFQFDPLYAKSREFGSTYGVEGSGVPMVLDWAVGDGTCAEAKKVNSSYACVAVNSECTDAPNGLGYRCICSQGYQGNPYLHGGCQDINECDSPSQYPCNGTCSNTMGSYNCSCPMGTQSDDPKTTPCTPIPSPNQPGVNPASSQHEVKFVIGISIGFMFLIIFIFTLVVKCQRRKLAKEKEKFFKQNGGQILYQQILSKQVDTVIIFTEEELKKATNNFDKSREMGIGGHGTVYKGILKDKVVAVKRSKVMNVAQTEEFVQEIIILSQINHKNVVRLLGCCLEVEVPILVYEFIPNGTLYHLIHGNHYDRPTVSLDVRLKIAQESAEALAYLHISTNRPIVHGDVKSLNILLDDNYTAKVSDFGASRMLPKGADQVMTIVKGTLGYLDPEYLQERKLTEKSDVYSFGLVLLELITRKKAVYSEGPEEGSNLASCFLLAKKEKRVKGILDTGIVNAEMEKLLQEVSELAGQCLSIKGEERPSMTQVADKLKAIRSNWRELLLIKHNEAELPTERSGEASGALSPSMYWTARMLGMDIEIAQTDSALSTYMTSECV